MTTHDAWFAASSRIPDTRLGDRKFRRRTGRSRIGSARLAACAIVVAPGSTSWHFATVVAASLRLKGHRNAAKLSFKAKAWAEELLFVRWAFCSVPAASHGAPDGEQQDRRACRRQLADAGLVIGNRRGALWTDRRPPVVAFKDGIGAALIRT